MQASKNRTVVKQRIVKDSNVEHEGGSRRAEPLQKRSTTPLSVSQRQRNGGSARSSLPRRRSSVSVKSNSNKSPQLSMITSNRAVEDRRSYDGISVIHQFKGDSRCAAAGMERTVWTGEANGSILVRNSSTGEPEETLEAFEKGIPITMLKVDNRMWVGYNDGALRVFDLVTRRLVRENVQNTSAIQCMCQFDGYVYTGGADWKIYKWDSEDGEFERQLYGHSNAVRCLAGYHDPATGKPLLVSGGEDNAVKVWNPNAPRQISEDVACQFTLKAHTGSVLALVVLEDVSELWTGSQDGTIRAWDISNFDCIGLLEQHQAPVVSLIRVHDTVWSGSRDNAVVVWEICSHEVFCSGCAVGSDLTIPIGVHGSRMMMHQVEMCVVCNVWITTNDGQWQSWSAKLTANGDSTALQPPLKKRESATRWGEKNIIHPLPSFKALSRPNAESLKLESGHDDSNKRPPPSQTIPSARLRRQRHTQAETTNAHTTQEEHDKELRKRFKEVEREVDDAINGRRRSHPSMTNRRFSTEGNEESLNAVENSIRADVVNELRREIAAMKANLESEKEKRTRAEENFSRERVKFETLRRDMLRGLSSSGNSESVEKERDRDRQRILELQKTVKRLEDANQKPSAPYDGPRWSHGNGKSDLEKARRRERMENEMRRKEFINA